MTEELLEHQDNPMRWLAIIGLPVIVIIFYITASLHFSFTPDDTYIYLQYARNLVNGNGMSFNPGEPTYGFTSPLWLLLIALGGKFGLDYYIVAKTLDLFFAAISIAIFFMVAYEIIRDILASFLAAFVFSFNGWLLKWAGSGMETSLAVLLLLLAFWYCLRNEYLLAIILAALLTLVRPESFILVGLILADLYINSHSIQRMIQTGTKLVLVYIALQIPWWIYSAVTFGTIVPNTALAKSAMRFNFFDMAETFVRAIGTLGVTDGLLFFLLLVFGIIWILKKKSMTDEEGKFERFFVFRQSFVCISWLLLLTFFYSISGVNVFSRYLVVLVPGIVIPVFFIAHRLLLKVQMKRAVVIGLCLLAGLGATQNEYAYSKIILPRTTTFEESYMEYVFIPIGKWLESNTPEDATVVMPDVGAIGYFSKRKIYDTAGLISPEYIPILHAGNTPYGIIDKKLYKQFCNPDYVVHCSKSSELLQDSSLAPLITRVVGSQKIVNLNPSYYTVYRVKHGEPK